jgi:hypothetical protein
VPHRREATADEIKRVATAYGVRFPVVQGGWFDSGVRDTIPRTIVFGHTGVCVNEGAAARADAKVRQAVGAALVGDVAEPTRPIAAVADMLQKGGPPADALRKLNTLKNDPDPKTAAAAKAIVGRILAVAEKRLADAKATAAEEPVAAYDAAQRTAARWKGFPIGTQAAELAAKWKQEKAVAAELKVRPQLETVRKLDAEITARVGTAQVGPLELKRTFGSELKKIGTTVAQMRKAAADAPATKEAEEIAKKYGVAAK